MELRPTTDDDLPAMYSVFLEAIGELWRRHRFEPPSPSLEVFANQQRHISRTGASVVAERDGTMVGFGASFTRGDDWFLSSLFVAPRTQAGGLGSELLEAVWGDASRRRTITDAIQPVSNALYARRGLVPATPILTFSGRPAVDEPAVPADADVRAVDARAYGFDRSVDHRYWERLALRTTWGDAYSYVFPGGDIGPVAGLEPAAAARALAAELTRAGGDVRVRIPGSSRALVEVALRAGLRLAPVPGLLLLSAGVVPPAALAPSGYVLF
ncbi:MAG: GNAT family N-acetyltransferase [Gaiellaceae bacterium]